MSAPVATLKTARLILRPVGLEDAPDYEKHFVDYEVIRNLAAAVPWPYPAGGVEAFLRDVILPRQGLDRWTWGIFRKENPGALIGCVDLWRAGNPENRGFWLGRAYWGQGLMAEATDTVTDHAFTHLGFEKLVFSNAVGNLRSRRVKEKAGARLIGTRPARFVDPAFTVSETWELTKEEWRAHWKSGAEDDFATGDDESRGD